MTPKVNYNSCTEKKSLRKVRKICLTIVQCPQADTGPRIIVTTKDVHFYLSRIIMDFEKDRAEIQSELTQNKYMVWEMAHETSF